MVGGKAIVPEGPEDPLSYARPGQFRLIGPRLERPAGLVNARLRMRLLRQRCGVVAGYVACVWQAREAVQDRRNRERAESYAEARSRLRG